MKIFASFLLILFSTEVFSQNSFENNTLPLVAYWDSGKVLNGSFVFEQIETKQNIKNITKVTNSFSWEIENYKNKKYDIILTYKQVEHIAKSDSFWVLYFNSLKNIPIKYSSNEMGMLDSIKDLKKLQTDILQNIDSAFKNLEWKNSESMTYLVNGLKETVANQDAFKSFIYEDLINLHLFYGLEYQLNRTYTYKGFMPSLTGGSVYPAKKTLKLANVTDNKARMLMNLNPSPEEFKKIHFNNLKDFYNQLGTPSPSKKEAEACKVFITLENNYSVDFAYPICIKFTHFSDQVQFQTKIIKTFTFN